MNTKIHWLTNHYTYYNDYLFSKIVENQSYNLQVYYRALVLETHPWTEEIESKYAYALLNINICGFDFQLLKKACKSNDYFVVAGWDCLTYILVITVLSLRNTAFAVFTDTPRLPEKSFKQLLKKLWLRFVFRKNSKAKLFVTGNVGAKMAEKALEVPSQHIINFPFATNNYFFYPKDILTESDYITKQFLSVGRIEFSHKGQDVTIRALRLLLDRGYSNFIYKVAGAGEDLDNIKTLIENLGLSRYVVLMGWIEIKALPDLFNMAHFTVHSSHQDPFPNSILESLSCGTPVISSDVAGSGLDRIVPGINGYLHEDNNFVDLANKLEKAYNLPFIAYMKMRESARSKALEWQVTYNIMTLDSVIQNGPKNVN